MSTPQNVSTDNDLSDSFLPPFALPIEQILTRLAPFGDIDVAVYHPAHAYGDDVIIDLYEEALTIPFADLFQDVNENDSVPELISNEYDSLSDLYSYQGENDHLLGSSPPDDPIVPDAVDIPSSHPELLHIGGVVYEFRDGQLHPLLVADTVTPATRSVTFEAETRFVPPESLYDDLCCDSALCREYQRLRSITPDLRAVRDLDQRHNIFHIQRTNIHLSTEAFMDDVGNFCLFAYTAFVVVFGWAYSNIALAVCVYYFLKLVRNLLFSFHVV